MYTVVPFESRWCVTGPFLALGDAVFASEEDALMACLAAEQVTTVTTLTSDVRWPPRPPSPTLPGMPLTRADEPDAETSKPDLFAWDPDPVVVVSRRPRVLYFPPELLLREPSEKDIAKWTSDEWSSTQNKQLAVGAGVTFLGTFTSSWAYLSTAVGHAPKGPPPADKCILVEPYTFASATMRQRGSGNVDPETGRLIPARVHAALRRVMDFQEKHVNPHLFATTDGFDAPEVMLLPLSEVFTQRTERGQQAHIAVLTAIPHLRANRHEVMTPLGALHDYAMKHKNRAGEPIVNACRAWAARKKIG